MNSILSNRIAGVADAGGGCRFTVGTRAVVVDDVGTGTGCGASL